VASPYHSKPGSYIHQASFPAHEFHHLLHQLSQCLELC